MDDLGNIFYILFAIVAVVFNIMRKGNKAKPSTPPPVEKNDPFEDMIPKFEQLFKPEESEATQPEVDQNQTTIKKQQPIVKPEPVLNDFEIRKQQLQSREKWIPKKEKVNEPIEVRSDSAPHWFNAKQAIIYSEILKRPEF